MEKQLEGAGFAVRDGNGERQRKRKEKEEE